MNARLLLFAAILALAAPALRAEDDDADEAPAAEHETEAAPAPAAAPAAEGQALGGAGMRRQKSPKPGPRKAAPAESAGQGASEAEDGEESEEPVRRRQGARTPVSGGGSGGGSPGGPAPAGITVYESLNYPTFDPIPHKGAHPHFVFRAVGEGVSIRFTGTAGGGWNVSSGTEGYDCNAHLWISSSPGGKPVGPACDDDPPPGSPAQNYITVDFVSASPKHACALKAGRHYYVNMMVKSKWGHCSLYLDPMGSVR